MARKKDLPCNRCGELMWRGKGVLPAGMARCQPCRRIEPTRANPNLRHELTCNGCSITFRAAHRARKYCSRKCSVKAVGIAQQIRPMDDPRVKRTQRETAAPGLSAKRRAKLNHLWQKQGRTCTYCPAKAATVDHVVPLVRGGTNHEGNLAPCCKSCNSSKSGALIVEWRTGKRPPRMVTESSSNAIILR